MDNINDPALVLLRLDEVAAYLKLHHKTVTRMINDGRLVAYRVGREWRVRTDDLMRCAFAQCSQPPVAPVKIETVSPNGSLTETAVDVDPPHDCDVDGNCYAFAVGRSVRT